MNCPICDSVMIRADAGYVLTSYPPKTPIVMWCGCGYKETVGYETAEYPEDNLRERWEAAQNKDGLYAPV